MFRHEGVERSEHHNQRLAAYLALVAGFVNSAGFVLIGSFSSHVTGNVGRFADDLALGHATALYPALMVIAFFAGAFAASMAIESNVVRHRPTTYGGLLLCEAGVLAAFVGMSYLFDDRTPRFQDAQAMLLCFAMGLQNSLVTRLSGAVVRTTHLTGVVTDLGIETARWFRHWRAQAGAHTRLRLVAGSEEGVPPQRPKTLLLLTIFVAFVIGSALGGVLAVALGRLVFVVPTLVLAGGGGFALVTGGSFDSRRP